MPRARCTPAPQAARLLALALAMALAAACDRDARPRREAPPAAQISPGPHDVAVLELRGLGEIRIELLPEIAPATVEHFERLVARGFYDGTSFHRVLPGFMIQGGDPNTKNLDPRDDGQGGAGISIPDEFSDSPQRRGTVSMAHQGHPGTASSQFFILHGDAAHLDGSYTAFGRVVAGMPVVDAVTRLEIDKYGRYGPRDRPYPVSATIESLRIEPAGGVAAAPPATLPSPVAR